MSTLGLTEPVHRAIATRLRRGQTVEQLVSVGKRTTWWTEDDVDWVAAGNDGPRPDGWTLSAAVDVDLVHAHAARQLAAAGLDVELVVDDGHTIERGPVKVLRDGQWEDAVPPATETPTEGAASDFITSGAAGTAPDPEGSGHGYAGPDAQPQVSPSRSHSGEGGGLGASDAPAEPPATAVRTCRHCGCTDDNACVGNGGRPCSWVSADDCSACVPIIEVGPILVTESMAVDGTWVPATAPPETPPAAADSGEAASATPAALVADHRSAPPAAPSTGSGDLLAVGLQHEDRAVRAAAVRAASAVDQLVSALARARRR